MSPLEFLSFFTILVWSSLEFLSGHIFSLSCQNLSFKVVTIRVFALSQFEFLSCHKLNSNFFYWNFFCKKNKLFWRNFFWKNVCFWEFFFGKKMFFWWILLDEVSLLVKKVKVKKVLKKMVENSFMADNLVWWKKILKKEEKNCELFFSEKKNFLVKYFLVKVYFLMKKVFFMEKKVLRSLLSLLSLLSYCHYCHYCHYWQTDRPTNQPTDRRLDV